VWIAEAVHQNDADAMAGMCALERRHIVQFDGEADHFQAAFAIALWPERKEVGAMKHEQRAIWAGSGKSSHLLIPAAEAGSAHLELASCHPEDAASGTY
jgi:hypothetical protein